MNKELYYKAKACKTVDELIALSNKTAQPLTKEAATKIYEGIQKMGQLNDNELNAVSGGKWPWEDDVSNPPAPKFKVGDYVSYTEMFQYITAHVVSVSETRESFWGINPEWEYEVDPECNASNCKKYESDLTKI